MARACAYCGVTAPESARLCPQCGAPVPPPPSRPGEPGSGWTRWVDPTEGAFAVLLPEGWGAQGGILRNGFSGLPEARFEARGDAEGRLRVRIGGQAWPFQDTGGGGGLLGGLMQAMGGLAGMGGAEGLSWRPAQPFAETWLLARLRQACPDAVLVGADPRPEAEGTLHRKLAADAAARGLWGSTPECSVAEVLIRYTEGGIRFLERIRVQTLRLQSGGMGWMSGMAPPGPWFGEVAFDFRAPEAGFQGAEAALRAIAESHQKNPAWEMAQLNADNARPLASQQQNQGRQQQVSRTLSETSDVVAGAYWSSQQIHQQHEAGRQAMGASGGGGWQQDWSNAMLGWEDRVDDAGNRFSVASGHERMWRDAQGNFIAGNAGTNPDPTWQELKKRGT